jgi:hypothetical protein
MSTDYQRYSIEHQTLVLEAYAASHGLTIVRTYRDEGESGLRIRNRKGLRALLDDVSNGNADFQHLLVCDVTGIIDYFLIPTTEMKKIRVCLRETLRYSRFDKYHAPSINSAVRKIMEAVARANQLSLTTAAPKNCDDQPGPKERPAACRSD